LDTDCASATAGPDADAAADVSRLADSGLSWGGVREWWLGSRSVVVLRHTDID